MPHPRPYVRPAQWTLLSAAALLTTVGAAFAQEEGPAAPPPPSEPPLFENVRHLVGLDGVRGKACILTDLDGDGRLDLVLDRRRFYRNVPAADSYTGFRFESFEPHGSAPSMVWTRLSSPICCGRRPSAKTSCRRCGGRQRRCRGAVIGRSS